MLNISDLLNFFA